MKNSVPLKTKAVFFLQSMSIIHESADCAKCFLKRVLTKDQAFNLIFFVERFVSLHLEASKQNTQNALAKSFRWCFSRSIFPYAGGCSFLYLKFAYLLLVQIFQDSSIESLFRYASRYLKKHVMDFFGNLREKTWTDICNILELHVRVLMTRHFVLKTSKL